MNSSPSISVLMPVFNGGVNLRKAVVSILSQTLADFEIIIIDDGSTDDAVVKIRALGDLRIRVIGDTARRGTAMRRNEGIDAARGKYIACMDADDIAFPERLEKQARFLDANQEIDLVGCRAVVFRDRDGVIGVHPFAARHEDICARPWRGFPLPQPTWMGRASWFRRFRYAIPYVVRAEDQELLLRSHGESRFACLDEVLLGYRQSAFDLRKTLVARRHLLAAQMRYFIARRQWKNAALAFTLTAVKIGVDLLAALPGCDRLFFARMGGAVPEKDARNLDDMLREAKPEARSKKLFYLVTEDWFFCSHFIERAAAAREAGHDVAVMTRIGKHGDVIRARGLRVIPLRIDRRSANIFRELGVVRQIWRAYRAEKPDIAHHVALKPVLYGSIAARLAGVAHIVNAPVGMGYIFVSRSFYARFLRLFVAFGLRALLNPPGSKVVFENRDDMETLIAARYVRREDAVLIRGAGIDIDVFRPAPEAAGMPTVILTARMLWDKGVGEFVEAARILRARGVPARFLLVGAPDPLNRAAIPEQTLRRWNEEGAAEWLGFRSDIRAVVESSAIVCLPSYREGLPKSLLEALACGKPVVATDVPGCRETVIDGVNGLLVPPRDANALADALGALLASPGKRAAMGQAGRKMAEQEFAQTKIIAETLRVYWTF